MKLALPNLSRFIFANPAKTSRIERGVFAIGLLCCLLGLLGLLRWGPSDPIAKVRLDADFKGLAASDVWPYIQELFGEDLLSVDLPALAERLESHPWIQQVNMRRVWPDSVVIDVTEPEPFAHWVGLRGEEGFLTASGVALEANATPAMPLTYEGDDKHVAAFLDWQEKLDTAIEPQGWMLKKLSRSDYGQWRAYVVDADGVKVELRFGEQWSLPRWKRFDAAWNAGLKDRRKEIAYVDLRYRGGMAVAWQPVVGLLDEQNKITHLDLSSRALAPQGV